MTFGEKLRDRRIKLGLTLEQVGEAVGVAKATILRYETGDIQNVRHDKIAKLAAALHVAPAYLMGWDEEESTQGIANDVNLLLTRPELKELLMLAKDSSREEIEQLSKMIAAFRKHG